MLLYIILIYYVGITYVGISYVGISYVGITYVGTSYVGISSSSTNVSNDSNNIYQHLRIAIVVAVIVTALIAVGPGLACVLHVARPFRHRREVEDGVFQVPVLRSAAAHHPAQDRCRVSVRTMPDSEEQCEKVERLSLLHRAEKTFTI